MNGWLICAWFLGAFWTALAMVAQGLKTSNERPLAYAMTASALCMSAIAWPLVLLVWGTLFLAEKHLESER